MLKIGLIYVLVFSFAGMVGIGKSDTPNTVVSEFPLMWIEDTPAIQATVDEVSGTYMVDTGASATILKLSEWKKHHSMMDLNLLQSILSGSANGDVTGYVQPADVVFGKLVKTDRIVVAPVTLPDGVVGVIGDSTLMQFQNVVIDYKHSKIRLQL